MKRARVFSCVLGLSSLLLPARFALGDNGATVGGESPEITPLVGVWSVSVEPDSASVNNGRNAFNDMLLFEEDGNFTAEAFGPLGFGRSMFTVTDLSGALAFTTTASNDSQGTLVWNGVLNGRRIVGTLVWTKPDGSSGTYNFTAISTEPEPDE